MYPQLPENLAALSADDLRSLAKEFRAARKQFAIDNPQMDAEQFAEWEKGGQVINMLLGLAADAQAEEDEAAAQVAAITEAAAEPADDEDEDDVEEDDDEVEEEASGIVVPSASLSLEGTETRTLVRTGWVSTGLGGVDRGTDFASTRDLGAAVQEVMAAMAAGDQDKRVIATMKGNFNENQRISGDDLFVDLAKLTNAEEIEAAFCTPLQPLYDIGCANVTRRPVFGGLPVFTPDANRGGFRVPESPSLTDITGGYGQWTSANDADTEAIKNACQTISCVDWNDFEWYATYRCLTVKNMMQMTFPELVDAYLNRLQAAWARYAEVLLLEAMGTASTSIDGFAQGYGANVSLQRNILTYLGKYAEIERWDAPVVDAWMPRWLLWALRMDIASRRKSEGGMVPSVASVEQGFRDVGVEPHWFMDRPSWGTPFGNFAVNGDLTNFPSRVEILLHRRGKFAVMDKGELNVGLGGNPIRIEEDLRRNQATFFFESFEGLIDTDSCPAHLITIPGLCYNGVQIADQFIACEGHDVVGEGSGQA